MARTLLLTRAAPQAKEFAQRVVQTTDFLCHIAPMQKMQHIAVDLDLSQTDGLIFTSRNGVESFAFNTDIRDIPAYCVGPATAQAAENAGFVAHAAAGDAHSLLALIKGSDLKNPLHLHGVHKTVAPDLAPVSVAIYEQVALPLNTETKAHLAAGKIDAVALFSPRSSQLLADQWDATWPMPDFYCISANAAAPIEHLGQAKISTEPSADAMLSMLQN